MLNRFLLLIVLMLAATTVFAGGKKDAEPEEVQDVEAQEQEEPESSEPGTLIQIGTTEDVAARVNGVVITNEDLTRLLTATRQQYAAAGQFISDDQLAELSPQLLDQLIGQELLYQEGIARGYEQDPSSVDLQYQQMRAQFADDTQWQDALAQNLLTEETLRAELRRNDIIRQVAGVVLAEVPPPTEDEIQAFYDTNGTFFQTPEQIQASHILISTEGLTSDEDLADAFTRAEAIRTELLGGADFAQTAIEKSEGPSGPRGGDLGAFGRGQMVAPFEEAAFTLEVGEISEIVQTQFGYHIIRVSQRVPAGVLPLEDVSANITQYLAQEAQGTALEAFTVSLRDVADVEVPQAQD